MTSRTHRSAASHRASDATPDPAAALALLDDGALVARLLEDDPAAAREFVRRYSALLLKVAGDDLPASIRGRVGASDVVQEAWIVVLERLPSWKADGTDSLRRWLLGVLRNVLRNRSKREHRARRSARRDVPLAGGDQPGELADRLAMTVELTQRELSRMKDAAEERLPSATRDLLRLVEEEGLRGRALAARLDALEAGRGPSAKRARRTGADAARKRYERAYAARERALRDLAGEAARARKEARRGARTADDAPVASRLERGTRVGRFRIDAHVGSGAMASVYRATVVEPAPALSRGATVAIKVLSEAVSASAAMAERFRRETDVGRRVKSPHVVRVLGRGRFALGGAPRLYLVAEFVDGEDLAARLARAGPLDEPTWRRVALALARGLAAVHALGAVHRDVKPSNVLLGRDGGVRLADLGLIRMDDGARGPTKTGAFVGSVEFAAPERLRRGGRHDERADLYALGVTMFMAATGAHPFAGTTGLRGSIARAARRDAAPSARAARAAVSPFHDAVIATLMAARPEERFESAAALADVLVAGPSSAWWARRPPSHGARSEGVA